MSPLRSDVVTLAAILAVVNDQTYTVASTGLPMTMLDPNGDPTYKICLDGRTAKALTKRGFGVHEARNASGVFYIWPGEIEPDQRKMPQRDTYNMMNREAGTFPIDEDTPNCCDPASETYWSA